MEDSEKAITELLEPYPEDLRAFARELRAWLKNEFKPAYELAGMSAQSFNIGYGFTTTAWDCFCAIIVYRKHINLSLPSGACLDDPQGLLHGSGARVRHLKITSLNDLKTPAARAILKRARKNALDLLLDGRPQHEGVLTIVKRREK